MSLVSPLQKQRERERERERETIELISMTQLETIRYVFLPIAVVVVHKSREREGESIQLISKTQ